MAKSTNKGSGAGPARIRFIVLEAEIPDGDLTQVTLAVQNALRPVDAAGTVRRIISGPSKSQSAGNQDGSADDQIDPDDVSVEDLGDGGGPGAEPPKRGKSGVTWKPRSPNIIDVDLKSGPVPFADFAGQKKPPSHNMKNLVVAAWFKLHRSTDAVTMDHVYTCYRAVNWPSGMADFGITLRGLKKAKLMDQKGKGLFAINHIGMSRVEELGGYRSNDS